MKIGVVGGGVVGHATARCWMEHGEVRVYDKLPERSTHPLVYPGPGKAVLDCDVIFVCLPTPTSETTGKADPSPVFEFFQDITTRPDVYQDIVRSKNFVLRSTLPVGATAILAKVFELESVVHSPEFLTARCAVTDAQLPARNIIGYPDFVPIPENTAAHPLRDMYADRFPGVPIHEMLSNESEAVKLITNGFFSVKVAFFNEVYQMCKSFGMSWETVRAAILADGRIAHSHTQVPGPDGKYGFGGACLPKDLRALIESINASGNDAPLCSSASDRNVGDRQRSTS